MPSRTCVRGFFYIALGYCLRNVCCLWVKESDAHTGKVPAWCGVSRLFLVSKGDVVTRYLLRKEEEREKKRTYRLWEGKRLGEGSSNGGGCAQAVDQHIY